MKFTVTYTPNDLYEANKLHLQSLMKYKTFFVIIAGLAMGIMGINVVLRAYSREFDVVFFLTLIGTLTMLICLSYQFGPVARRFSRINFQKSKGLHVLHEIEINEKGLKAKSEFGSGFTKWESFNKYAYNDKILLVYHTTRIFNMIPRRCIISDDDWSKLIDLVKKKIKCDGRTKENSI